MPCVTVEACDCSISEWINVRMRFFNAMVPELSEKGILALPQPVRLYIEGKKPVQKQAQPAAETTFMSKAIPQPLTDTQIQDRREMLRQQAEQIEARRTH